jgi:hypothetical protein
MCQKRNGEGSILYRRKINIFKASHPRKKNIYIFTKQTWTMFSYSPRRFLHFLNIRRLFLYQDHPPVCHPLLLSIIPLFFLSLAPTLLYNVRNTPGRKLLAGLFCHAYPYLWRHHERPVELFIPVNKRYGWKKYEKFWLLQTSYCYWRPPWSHQHHLRYMIPNYFTLY